MRLRRPLPLTPSLVAEMRVDYTLEEIGALVLLATDWWVDGALPRSTYAAMKLLDVQWGTAKRMTTLLKPCFAPDRTLGLLRAAHIAKARRRAKAAVASTKARMAKRGRPEADLREREGVEGVV